MRSRESIELPGFRHGNPVPVASRKGPFLFSGVLTGREPRTGAIPPDLTSQVKNVFAHTRELMSAVGSSPDDIVKMTFWLVDSHDRAALNESWSEMFPDHRSRPARHVIRADLDRGMLVHADLVAVLDS